MSAKVVRSVSSYRDKPQLEPFSFIREKQPMFRLSEGFTSDDWGYQSVDCDPATDPQCLQKIIDYQINPIQTGLADYVKRVDNLDDRLVNQQDKLTEFQRDRLTELREGKKQSLLDGFREDNQALTNSEQHFAIAGIVTLVTLAISTLLVYKDASW
jgi:hypothetical protein